MKKILTLAFASAIVFASFAQTTFHRNGVNDVRERYYAFTHATVQTDYQTIIKDATLIIRDGKIENVGSNLSVPKGATVVDLTGKFIYPSFIDIYSDYGMPPIKKDDGGGRRSPQYESNKQGAYDWNQAVHPEVNANEIFDAGATQAKQLRDAGFGMVSTHQMDGIVRGTGSAVLLGDERDNNLFIKDRDAEYYSFDKGSSTQQYPASLMGSIALIRQTYYDAQWYKNTAAKTEYNISLDALNKSMSLPQIFAVSNAYGILRADKIGKEFGIHYIIKTAGDEYQRLDDVKATGQTLIVPINFPVAYDVSDPYDASLISLSVMMNWEMAPSNPAALEKAGVNFALTTADLSDKKDFWKNLRKAIDYGLSTSQALKSLTYTPANLLNVYDQVGSLQKGKVADFIICSDSLFSSKNIIYQNWIRGIEYAVNGFDFKDVRGNYQLTIGTQSFKLTIDGSASQPDATIKTIDSTKLKTTFSRADELISLSFHYPKDTSTTTYLLSGYLKDKNLEGSGQDVNGNWISWSATFESPLVVPKDTSKKTKPKMFSKVLYPFDGFGNATIPKQETFLFKNATVWTNEYDGILQNTDVLIQNGKIAQIGKNISAPPNAKVIDATGKDLTSGIIDEHSHIAIEGDVNEGTHAVTSEVRIGDVVNPSDVSIYRSLAGGVTVAHLLHGSANPIGGQTQLIKMRWGYEPEQMKFDGWPGFIKFALGENVKQSNWGEQFATRFPQTRMGVEQIDFDAFIRAKDYEAKWDTYNKLTAKQKSSTQAPRRDLQLDALVEILQGKRFITCHSYVQSEINMLMHVADSMGFKMNTFTHILEGYKVADKMKAAGVYASNFADWWDYKFEVYDAIPYNGAILTKEGIVTAVNSDDAEMQRRLNQEAAKSVKYGALSEEEAWKMCTLNPAKMLHVDDKVGSMKVGKDADVVLWSDDPLSIYARCEMTLVDGICFYSSTDDKTKVQWIQQQRTRLINEMLQAKAKGEPTQKPSISFGEAADE